MTHQLRPEDLTFTERAPFRQTCTRELRASADAIFEQLAAHPENWPRWFAPANDVHFEGSPPYGVGSLRHFRLYRVIRARERIIAWDPGTRFAYCAQEVNTLGVSALVEEWILTPTAKTADSRTTVTWTLAVESKPPVNLLLRASRHHINKLFMESIQRLEALCPRQ
ncbi:SRPBCC family protein [Streptomyces sp. NPDC101165]|uniref:SRPBCC family protein n=1 Tax=Streptomyces sp. NPDC101165 TaxID=3366119 RepID=UPI003818C1B6